MTTADRYPGQALTRGDAHIAVVMGVSGSGKTTIGQALASRLGWEFADADAFHPPENIAKMSAGQPLDDNDRAPWLAAIAARIDQWRGQGKHGVVTCSALKRRYRDVIVGDRPDVRLVYLDGGRDLIASRLGARRGHFMPSALLDSQFDALEPPSPDENPLIVSIDQPVTAIVEDLVIALSRPTATISPPHGAAIDRSRYTPTDISGAPAPRREQKAWPIRSGN